MDEKGLGRRLQLARQAAGFTQQMLCQKADLSYSTLAKIERGAIKSPSIFTIQSIANALDTSLDKLLGNDTSLTIKPKHYSERGISFVYFDVNGCLVHFFHRAFTKLSEVSGVPSDIVESEFWHYNDLVCRGEMTVDAFNKKLAKKLKLPSVDWQSYYLKAIDPVPEMDSFIHWVSEHYHIGLLTNTMPGFIDELIKVGYVPNIKYDALIDSSKVGAIKPEVEMYKAAQKAANCPDSEILLVDDSRTNLMAAQKLGWHVSWFDDYNSRSSIKRIRSSLKPA